MKHISVTCDICRNVIDQGRHPSTITAFEKFQNSSGGDAFVSVQDCCNVCADQLKSAFRLGYIEVLSRYKTKQ